MGFSKTAVTLFNFFVEKSPSGSKIGKYNVRMRTVFETIVIKWYQHFIICKWYQSDSEPKISNIFARTRWKNARWRQRCLHKKESSLFEIKLFLLVWMKEKNWCHVKFNFYSWLFVKVVNLCYVLIIKSLYESKGSFPVPPFQNTEFYVCFTCYYG